MGMAPDLLEQCEAFPADALRDIGNNLLKRNFRSRAFINGALCVAAFAGNHVVADPVNHVAAAPQLEWDDCGASCIELADDAATAPESFAAAGEAKKIDPAKLAKLWAILRTVLPLLMG